MKFKVMLSAILFGVILLSAILSSWKFSHTLSLEKKKQIFQHAEKQTELARATIESAIEPLRSQLYQLAEAESSFKAIPSQTPNLNSQSEKLKDSRFIGLSLLVFNSGESKWRPQYASFNSNHWIQNFDYFQSILNSLPLARVASEKMTFARILDRKGQPQIVVLQEVEINNKEQMKQKAILLGLLPIQYFSKLSQVSKAQEQELFLIDSQGYALAYPKQQYLGSKFVNDFIARLASAQKLKNRGVFRDENGGMMLGVYEKVKGANLYVVYNIPVLPPGNLAAGLLLDLTFTHFSIGVLAILLVWLLIGPIIGQWEYFKSSILNLSEKKPLEMAHSLGSNDLPLFEALQGLQNRVLSDSERSEIGVQTAELQRIKDKELVEKLSQGLVESLRGPLAAILGHAQLARSESADSTTKTHYTVIEREARRSREILENLKQYLGEEELETQQCDFQEIVLKALSKKRVQLDQRSIQIQKDLNGSAIVKVNEHQLIQVVDQLIENAIESMIGSDERTLTLKLETLGENQVVLRVHDTGVGISSDNLKRVFQPFFSTKPKDDNAGLGLSTAKSILEKFNGKISVTSEKGLGSCFNITLPLAVKSKIKKDSEEKNRIDKINGPSDESRLVDISITNSSISLLGKEPITGSLENDFPTAPEKDEITFVGESEELKLEEQKIDEDDLSEAVDDDNKTGLGGEG